MEQTCSSVSLHRIGPFLQIRDQESYYPYYIILTNCFLFVFSAFYPPPLFKVLLSKNQIKNIVFALFLTVMALYAGFIITDLPTRSQKQV